jgi:GNAT superfamily N-acetyltransferase
MTLQVRLARPDEAGALTDLILRAKASWGYDEAFMAACRAELTLTPQKMAAWTIWVAELKGALAGMIALGDGGEVEEFFVEPDRQGQGVGGALMATLVAAARARGLAALRLDADPNAEPIYVQLGFRTIGRAPSRSIPGRTLPRMQLDLA